jgi:hypothetical protein
MAKAGASHHREPHSGLWAFGLRLPHGPPTGPLLTLRGGAATWLQGGHTPHWPDWPTYRPKGLPLATYGHRLPPRPPTGHLLAIRGGLRTGPYWPQRNGRGRLRPAPTPTGHLRGPKTDLAKVAPMATASPTGQRREPLPGPTGHRLA